METALAGLQRAWEAAERQREQGDHATHRAFRSKVTPFFRDVSARLRDGRWHRDWNVFDVLGRTRLEDAHSDALAWLFDPREAHGMGTAAIKAFLGKSWEELPDREIVSVTTRRRLDAKSVIDIEVVGRGWWLAVENKIHSFEARGQAKKYATYYEGFRKAGDTVFLVFLTRRGQLAGERLHFRSMSYRELREALETLKPTTECGRFLVEQFCTHVRNDLEVPQ
jgi:hypothetical protein